jgi:hypothetical protein
VAGLLITLPGLRTRRPRPTVVVARSVGNDSMGKDSVGNDSVREDSEERVAIGD